MHGPFLAVSALLLAISTVIPIRGQASGSGKTDAPNGSFVEVDADIGCPRARWRDRSGDLRFPPRGFNRCRSFDVSRKAGRIQQPGHWFHCAESTLGQPQPYPGLPFRRRIPAGGPIRRRVECHGPDLNAPGAFPGFSGVSVVVWPFFSQRLAAVAATPVLWVSPIMATAASLLRLVILRRHVLFLRSTER